MGGNILGLVGTPDLAAFLGNHQAQVHSEPAVRGSRVRPHVGSRVHDGIFDLHRKCTTLFIHLPRCGRTAKSTKLLSIQISASAVLGIYILVLSLCEGTKSKDSHFPQSYKR